MELFLTCILCSHVGLDITIRINLFYPFTLSWLNWRKESGPRCTFKNLYLKGIQFHLCIDTQISQSISKPDWKLKAKWLTTENKKDFGTFIYLSYNFMHQKNLKVLDDKCCSEAKAYFLCKRFNLSHMGLFCLSLLGLSLFLKIP